MRRLALVVVALGALLVASVARGATPDLPLSVLDETPSTITLGWAAVSGADGYDFSVKGVRVSQTRDGSRTSARFGKVTGCSVSCYEVEAWRKDPLAKGGHPRAPACSNKRDDDADGKVDYPADPGCASATDTDETDAATPPPPPSAISSAECAARASVAGAVIANVTVNGGCSVQAPSVTIQDSTLSGSVEFRPGASGGKLLRSNALGFNLFGADNVLIEGNDFDGRGIDNQNVIWDEPAGNVPERWVIRGNSFTRYYIDDGVTHSEALYVGYSADGLIETNTFVDNGNTSHIFFTWFGNTANPSTSYPRRICVRGNTFGATHGAFYDVNLREEIPVTSGIRVQSDASITDTRFSGPC